MIYDKNSFLETFAVSPQEFRAADISWEELEEIAADYKKRISMLDQIRDQFIHEFLKNKDESTGLHSYRTRVKTPEHLVEKIIRKRTENYLKYKNLTKDNYMKFVTDTIGIRGLILYREDWVIFHKYLCSNFDNNSQNYVYDCLADFREDKDRYMAEPPKVHMRPGDFGDIYADWIASDNIFDQKHYRSVHYILKYEGVYVEVQVRTLFEEGWGEIDHSIVYPYKKADPMLTEFSELLNRLAGMGDEMASFYKRLQKVSSDNFQDKKSTVDMRRDYQYSQKRFTPVDMREIKTIDDAIQTIINK